MHKITILMKIRLIIPLISFAWLSSPCMGQGLSREQAENARKDVIDNWVKEVRERTDYITDRQSITRDGLEMKLSCSVFGQVPSDGHSLFISLHGGGNTPKEVNDQQWQNQWRLYAPKEGVYICPRAPYNDWDMHFKKGLDEFYKDIILYAYTHMKVNPDKVYILGYSAGGDGVWRLAPRMADTWAAASMMAGHPGDVSLVNLRNTPFMVWCGALDAAYDRNRKCAERIAELDSLHYADKEGYTYEGHIVEGKPHWMDRVDTLAVEWMAQYRRHPYPKTIVWRQEEVVHEHFYWISAPKEELERGKEVRIRVAGNTIFIDKCDYSSLTFGLNDKIVDLDKPVTIKYGKKTLVKKRLQRSRDIMEQTLHERDDARYAFDAKITVKNSGNPKF